MDTSSSSNTSQGVLTALVLVSLLTSLGIVVFLVKEQNRSASMQQEMLATLTALRATPAAPVTNQPPAVMTPPATTKPPVADPAQPVVPQPEDWATTIFDGVSISFPKNLSATTYEDEFFGGQRNLRISSSPTRKIGINSTGFKGYELVMRQIDDKQYTTARKESTVNPHVSSFIEMCDGETCPDAQYIFTKNGKRYLIEVLYQMSPYQAGIDLNNKVIASIK